jgi:hypothetical protein
LSYLVAKCNNDDGTMTLLTELLFKQRATATIRTGTLKPRDFVFADGIGMTPDAEPRGNTRQKLTNKTASSGATSRMSRRDSR